MTIDEPKQEVRFARHTLATIERGTTEWLARILEPGKEPQYFVPSGIYFGIAMSSRSFLEHALKDIYPGIRIVDEETFNSAVHSPR